MKKHTMFLEKHKGLVGMDSYHILVATKYTEMGDDALAVVIPCHNTKTLKVKLSKRFQHSTKEQQHAILLHELLHGRYQLFQDECNALTADLEEEFINDLERGFCELKGMGRNLYK